MGLSKRLVLDGAASLGIRACGLLSGFLLAVVLARKMGPAEYGTYTYALALISLLAVPAMSGLPTLVVRETARAEAGAEWAVMRGVWRWSSLLTASFSVVLAALVLAVARLFSDHFSSEQLDTVYCGLLLVPMIALGNLRGAALRGLRRVLSGQLPEIVLQPALLLALVLTGLWVLPAGFLTAARVMCLHVVAAALAFGIGAWALWRARPDPLRAGTAYVYKSRAWLAATMPLALVASAQLINTRTDLVVLGLFSDPEDVGLYRVAAHGATLVAFGLSAINMVAAPRFTRLHVEGDAENLELFARQSARIAVLTATPIAAAFVLFGGSILSWIFGDRYAAAYAPLAILTIGQIVNASVGSVGFLLNMTGHERDTARGVMAGALANVSLALLLVPRFGMHGAAIATATSLVVWNLCLWKAVQRRLGISTLPFDPPKGFRAAP